MKYKKNLIAGAIAACIAPAAHAQIELGSGFSVTGFVDMSYFNLDVDSADSTEKSLGIDQFETDFLFEGSKGVSAQVDIEYGGTSTTPETFVEQAFVTKSFGDDGKFSLKGGPVPELHGLGNGRAHRPVPVQLRGLSTVLLRLVPTGRVGAVRLRGGPTDGVRRQQRFRSGRLQ